MKILAVGNSFSQDATRYLHQIAKKGGIDMKVVNLYIGGCSLWSHYKNINNDSKAYGFEFNGFSTGLAVSVKEVLQSDRWDIVTVQQVSGESISYNTFQPYLNALCDYISFHAPKAKILIHQTWAYKEGSDALKRLGYKNQYEMYNDVKNAYAAACTELKTEYIPSGTAMQNLLKNGIEVIHRDPIHASPGIGRLTLALTWYEYLTGNSVNNIFLDEYDEPISEKELVIAKISAHDAVMTSKAANSAIQQNYK